MRRKLFIGAAILLSLVLLIIISAIFYIRSGRLDLYLQGEVIDALADVGIRGEIGKTNLDLRGYRVTLEDIRLFAGDSKKAFGEIESISAQFSVLSYLRQRIQITQVEVTRPRVWIEFDEQGRFNLADLHAPPSKEEVEEKSVIFLTSNFEVKQGEVNFVDLKRKITTQVKDLTAHLVPLEPESIEDKLNHRLEFGFTGATASVEGRAINNITANVLARVTETDAEILAIDGDPQFKITSDLGEIKAAGRIESFAPFRYAVPDVRADASLEQVARVFAPEAKMSGKIGFTGQAEGTGGDYRASGSLEASALSVEGFRVLGLKARTDVSGRDDEYSGKATLTSSQVSGQNVSINSIAFNDATVKGRMLDFDVTGALSIAALKAGQITANGFKAALALDRDKVRLSNFTASTLGGRITGSATLAHGGGSSSVEARFNSIDLDQAATLASARDVKVRGSADGTARLSFPRLDYKSATGRIVASFDAAISPPEKEDEAAPAKGEIALVATGRGFNFERAYVRSRQSEVTASGSVQWDGGGDLSIDFRSADMSEVWRVIEAFGVISEEAKEQYALALGGAGEFKGQVTGKLTEPSVSGHLKLDSIQLHAEEAGSFEGDIAYSPSLISLQNASLVRSDGSRADFNVSAPLEGKDNIAVKATVRSFDLVTIVRAIEPKLSDFVGRGAISGDIDLKGLPGPRTIEGNAKVSLTAGEFNLPSTEDGKEDRRVSVPELTGDVTLANSVLNVENLRMRIGDSEIAGHGNFNLDTYAYSVDARGNNLDLAQISDAATEAVKLTGTADVVITGQGKWGDTDDWSEANLNATIEGRSVAISGRDLGDAKLVAVTENGIVKIQATGVLLNEPRTLEATIDLRDRKNYPINATIEFTDADIGPYLGLVAPELSNVEGKATGSIKLGGPLLDPDRIQAVASLSKLELGGDIGNGQRYTIANQEPVLLTATPTEVKLAKVTFTGEATSLTLEGSITREASPSSSFTIDGELNLRFLNSFTDVVFATGIARLRASIVGSLESPRLLGVVNLQDVGVRVVDSPLAAANGNGQIRFTANQALIENFVAGTPGGGTIAIRGGAALAGLAPDRWRLEIEADQVGTEYPRDTLTVVDAALTLQGNRKLQVLSGSIDVRRASYTREITIEELITTGGPFRPDFLEAGPGTSGGPAGIATTLDLRVTADNTLSVKNNLADAIGSAYLNLRGPIDQPIVSGRILFTRGTLEFRNGQYDLSRALITIPPRRGADPTVDIQSEADIRGYHIIIGFRGTLAKLQTTVRSEPELPEPDIISLILTGTVSGDQSTVAATSQQGLGLAQSILSASLSEQLQRGTQRLFGLSRFSIDPLLVGRSNDPTARITIGQRITRDVTVTYSQNLTSGPSGIERVILLEYRLSNRFSVVGFRNEREELGFDIRLRRKF